MMALHSIMMQQGNGVDIEDINEEIQTFLKRKQAVELISESLICDKENIIENMSAISEELYLLGIPLKKYAVVNDDTIISLCNVIWDLLTKYRKLNCRAVNFENSIKKIEQNNEMLIKSDKKLRNELHTIKNEAATLKIDNNKLKSKIEIQTKEIVQLRADCDRLRKSLNSVEAKSKKEVKHVKVQMDILQNKFRGQCGTFVSKEAIENQTIKNLKDKEIKYIKEIEKLKQGNENLIHEILSMKEDIILIKHENLQLKE